jgi:preprotein translocase SecE subunit
VVKLERVPIIRGPWNFARRAVQVLKEVWAELNKVVWPSRAETKAYTLVVIVAVGVVAAYMGLLDVILNWVVLKLQLYR